MMRAALIALTAPLAACVAAAPQAPAAARSEAAPLRVVRADGSPFAFHEGAAARRQADAQCGAGGVRSSIYDRYDAGAWVFVEGCA